MQNMFEFGATKRKYDLKYLFLSSVYRLFNFYSSENG